MCVRVLNNGETFISCAAAEFKSFRFIFDETKVSVVDEKMKLRTDYCLERVRESKQFLLV
jgi:hypothetical protein